MSTKLRHGEGSVRPYTLTDGTVRWRARWREDGKQRSESRATEADAYALLIDKSGDRRTGRQVAYSLMTVRDAVERYLQRNQRRLSSNTVTEYERVAANHIYPHIGALHVRALTTGRLQTWVDALARKKRVRGKGVVSSGLVRMARNIVSRSLTDLVRIDELPRNPATGTTIPTGKATERVIWTEAEAAIVLATARTLDRQMEAFYRVALTTGMRSGEIRALKWTDIDFDAMVIQCRRTMTRKGGREIVGEATKTSRSRVIAVPKSTLDALRHRRATQAEAKLASIPGEWANAGLVFDSGNGSPWLQVAVRDRHLKVCKASGVPACRLHDLRHYAATALLRRGVNAKIVADLLGHATINTTLDIYSHVDLDMQRSATDILGEIAK